MSAPAHDNILYGVASAFTIATIYNSGLGGGGLFGGRIVEGDAGSGFRQVEGDAGSGVRQVEGTP